MPTQMPSRRRSPSDRDALEAAVAVPMRLDGHYDPDADIAWVRSEHYDGLRAVVEETSFGLREVDPSTGLVVSLEFWQARQWLPADVLKLFPPPGG